MSELIKTLDVSNYQPRDLTGLIHQYDISHVIVRLWLPGERPDPGWALDQIWSAQGNGCTVSGYYWGYRNWEPEWSVEQALVLWQRADAGEIPCLWSDIESYADEGCPDAVWTERACQAAEGSGVRGGGYLADWVIDAYWGGHVPATLRARPAWMARYDGRQTLEGVSHYWAQEMVLGHQWTGDPVDLSVMDKEVTLPPGEGAPPLSPPASYEWLTSTLGYCSYDVPNALDAEANRPKGPRAAQIHAIAEQLRTCAP